MKKPNNINVVGENSMMHPNAKIGKNTKIGYYSIIGYPDMEGKTVEVGCDSEIGNHISILPGTKIGDKVSIKDHSRIEEDVKVGNNVSIDAYSYVGKNVTIGDCSLILYGAKIYDNAEIGKHTRIGGFVAENTVIGDYATVFGKLIHSFRDPTHWDGDEDPPKIDDFVVIGFDSIVIGGVNIGEHVYIAAGAIVTKDIPPNSIVVDVNNIIPIKSWKGSLKISPFWRWRK